MIIVRANAELRQTFDRLIETMKVPVKWNGLFVVVDNYIILQGEVRSLFFHFDTRKVATNIIDIPVNEEDVRHAAGNIRVQNAINMILYAFGKWGNIKGLKVDKSFEELNRLFHNILQEIDVEPAYSYEYYRFFRNGMRITYEDVIQMALEYKNEDSNAAEDEKSGLWRKIVWKKKSTEFKRVKTTVQERRGGRLGNNFYMVGYLCPSCGKKLHMVVYPEGKEFRIETEEGGVLLARACTCDACRNFYTPRPRKLLAEGDAYIMQFADDVAAYEDYLELLGRDGERVSNYHCNEFADPTKREAELDAEDVEESLEELCASLPELSDMELRKLEARMEEGFYSDESTGKFEREVRNQSEQRRESGRTEHDEARSEEAGGRRGTGSGRNEAKSGRGAGSREKVMNGGSGAAQGTGRSRSEMEPDRDVQSGPNKAGLGGGTQGARNEAKADKGTPGGQREEAESRTAHIAGKSGGSGNSGSEDIIISPEEREETRQKYEARIKQLDRYSGRQLHELKKQLEWEKKLDPKTRGDYLARVVQKIAGARAEELSKKADACEGKSYIVIKRVLEEVEDADELPEEIKRPIRERLLEWKRQQAKREADQLVAKMPQNLDRKQYMQYVERIRDYEGVDLASYEEKLRAGRERAEQQEVANLVKRARKVSREDFVELAGRLRDGDFLPELVLPYIEKLDEKIRQIDAEEIALICPDPLHMSFEDGMQAYEKIKGGDFLPELKADALNMLTKRLSKIKTDECELLVKKLQAELLEAGVSENDRHHFYPARKALLGQASQAEIGVIEYALAAYAAGRGLFEYPILVVDATRNGTGKEGMILTPDHLYYSTLLSSYGMTIDSIRGIEATSGLLGKGLFVYQKNGTKTKLPYAVEGKELQTFAEVLDEFVHYLQEKPDSRNLLYLASEKHDTICCFRCGYEYRGGNVCPKCGYQNNE